MSVGLAGLAAGFAIGIVGDAGVRGTAQQPKLFVGMILILIFAEVLGLYGLIVALLLNTKAGGFTVFFLIRQMSDFSVHKHVTIKDFNIRVDRIDEVMRARICDRFIMLNF